MAGASLKRGRIFFGCRGGSRLRNSFLTWRVAWLETVSSDGPGEAQKQFPRLVSSPAGNSFFEEGDRKGWRFWLGFWYNSRI